MNKDEIEHIRAEEKASKKLADRYHVPYIDLESTPLDRALIQSVPVDFLHRLNFVPLEEEDGLVKIAVSDPSDLAAIDAIESFLGRKVLVYAASRRAIQEALRKSETAMQVLKDATEGFITQVVDRESGESEEVISIEKLAD